MYKIIGFRPHLTEAARSMLNRLFGDYGEMAFGVLLSLLPDGTIVEHDGLIKETYWGSLIPAQGGEYCNTPPEPYEFTADDYLISLYECAELYARVYWRKYGNSNPGGSSRPVYQTNPAGTSPLPERAGTFRRRLPVHSSGH